MVVPEAAHQLPRGPWLVQWNFQAKRQPASRTQGFRLNSSVFVISQPTNLHPDKPSSTFDGVTVSRPLAAAVYSLRFGHHIICLLEPDRYFDAEAHIVLYQSREIFSTGAPVCTSHQLPLVVSESDLAILATWPSILHQW
jgi:hypothetical protein